VDRSNKKRELDPSYYMPPHVYMSEDEDEILEKLDPELTNSEEYKELMKLLQMKHQQEEIKKNEHALNIIDGENKQLIHEGFRCDACGMEPIVGTRWRCSNCEEIQTDICNICKEKNHFETEYHKREHILNAMDKIEVSCYLDYNHEWISKEPNYLDPSFMST